MRTGTVFFRKRPPIFVEAELPRSIPITEGRHDCDYDVDTNRLGLELVRRAKACKLRRMRNRVPDATLPLGLNQKDIDRCGGVVVWDSESEGTTV